MSLVKVEWISLASLTSSSESMQRAGVSSLQIPATSHAPALKKTHSKSASASVKTHQRTKERSTCCTFLEGLSKEMGGRSAQAPQPSEAQVSSLLFFRDKTPNEVKKYEKNGESECSNARSTAVSVPLLQLIFPAEDLQAFRVHSSPLVFAKAMSPPPLLY